jgi:ATPase subunit of ABC transporter with duplicated ATPase domains
MSNLQVTSVTKSYGAKKLFEDVNVNFTAGKRYGLTGPNGAGKSTFMKILAGDIEPDTGGSVSRPSKTSVLRQDQFGYEDQRVLDVVMQGSPKLWAAMTEKEALLQLPEVSDEQGSRFGRAGDDHRRRGWLRR